MEFPSREDIVSGEAGSRIKRTHTELAHLLWQNGGKGDSFERDSIRAYELLKKDYNEFASINTLVKYWFGKQLRMAQTSPRFDESWMNDGGAERYVANEMVWRAEEKTTQQ